MEHHQIASFHADTESFFGERHRRLHTLKSQMCFKRRDLGRHAVVTHFLANIGGDALGTSRHDTRFCYVQDADMNFVFSHRTTSRSRSDQDKGRHPCPKRNLMPKSEPLYLTTLLGFGVF